MSELTTTTTDLIDEGLDTESVDLGTSDLSTSATTDLGDSDLEVGIGGQVITIDDELSSTSENPVQNKIITEALEDKADSDDLPTALTNLEIEAMLN